MVVNFYEESDQGITCLLGFPGTCLTLLLRRDRVNVIRRFRLRARGLAKRYNLYLFDDDYST